MRREKRDKTAARDRLRRRYKRVDSMLVLILLSVFQFISTIPVVFSDGKVYFLQWAMFIAFNLFEWAYVIVMKTVFKKVNFELELIAFFLCGNTVSIGRSRGNDIRLEAPNASRHHADLVLYEDGWAIVDANSSAGTTLNGERITEPQLLFEGDVIGLGDERLYFTRNPSLYK